MKDLISVLCHYFTVYVRITVDKTLQSLHWRGKQSLNQQTLSVCYCDVTIYAYINTLFEEQQQQQSLIIIDQANESLSTGFSWNISVLLRSLTIFLLKVHGVFEEAVNPIKWKREDDAK